jgi:hypothetical protein
MKHRNKTERLTPKNGTQTSPHPRTMTRSKVGQHPTPPASVLSSSSKTLT